MGNSEQRKETRNQRLIKGTRKQRYENYVRVLIVAVLVICEAAVWTWPVTDAAGEAVRPVQMVFGGRSVFAEEEPDKPPEDTAGTNATEEADGEVPQAPVLGAALTEEDRAYLILVNKTHAVDESYKPDDLADIKYFAADRDAAGRFMRAKAADAFHALSEAAAAEGFEIVVTTAYRSYGFQSVLYNNYVAREGQAAADTYSAQPGKSEHQTGLAADVSSPSVNYALTAEY